MVSLLFLFFLCACQSFDSGDSGPRVSSRDVGTAMVAEVGTVIQRRDVVIDGKRGGRRGGVSGVGTGLGAIAGGALGAGLGRSAGAAVVGALAGGVVGTALEGASKGGGRGGSNGFEYTVKLDKSGQVLSIVESQSLNIAIGQKVAVYRNLHNGHVRLEPIAYLG